MHRGRSSSDSCLSARPSLGQLHRLHPVGRCSSLAGRRRGVGSASSIFVRRSLSPFWVRAPHLTEVHSSPTFIGCVDVLSTDTPRADTVVATCRRLHLLGLLRHREHLAGLESLRIGRIAVPSVVLLVHCLAIPASKMKQPSDDNLLIGPQAHHCNAPANE